MVWYYCTRHVVQFQLALTNWCLINSTGKVPCCRINYLGLISQFKSLSMTKWLKNERVLGRS